MKSFIFFPVLIIASLCSNGQTKKSNVGGMEIEVFAVDSSINTLFFKVGYEPEFPGGVKALVKFAKSKISYPETAIRDSVHGSVILLFVIDKNGKVKNMKVVQSVRSDLDFVCLRMLSEMPKWKPAFLNDRQIEVYERLKITFLLSD